MAVIRLQGFRAELPIVEPVRLPDLVAQTTSNLKIDRGGIRSLGALGSSVGTAVATPKTIFQHYSGKWLSWTNDAYPVPAPVPDDTFDRVIFVGASYPQITDTTANGVTGPTYPEASYALKISTDTTPAALTVSINGGTPVEGLDETRSYIVTFVNGYGAESQPSGPSNNLVVQPGEEVLVSGLGPPGTPSDNDIDFQNIYRSATGSSGSAYLFVAQEPIASTTFQDDVLTSDLQEAILTIPYDHPEDTMTGMIALPNGVILGHSGKDLYLSEPYQVHAYPLEYRKSTEEVIVGSAAVSGGAVITTEGNPYILSGADPSAMSLDRLDITAPCLSARGMVDMGEFVVYPSADGLASVGAGGSGIVTRGIWSEEQWLALDPANMIACRWDNLYLCFYTGGSFALDPKNPNQGVLKFSQSALACYTHKPDGKVYIVASGTSITEWDAGSDLSYTWKSKRFRLERPTPFACMAVYAEAYADVNIKLYLHNPEDGGSPITTYGSIAITGPDPVRLPPGQYREVEVEVTGTDRVTEVVIAESMTELRSA